MAHRRCTILRSLLAWILLVCLLSETAPTVFAQRPLKDLRRGNIFYYYYQNTSRIAGYFFEKVIGDTIIQGQIYSKVYSDPWMMTANLRDRLPRTATTPIDTIRFERANDSALYEWVPKENTEYVRLRHLPSYKADEKFYLKTPFFDCSIGCTVGLNRGAVGYDLNGNPVSWIFLVTIGSYTFQIRYGTTGYGLTSISNSQNGQQIQEFYRVGAAFVGEEIFPSNGATINFIQQLDTLLQTSRITVGVREQEAAHSLSLAPNPVSDEAEVRFSLASSKRVRLALVDNLGRVLLSIADEQLPSGEHRFPVRAEALANGVYWVRLFADGLVQTVPMVVRR
ncbi:MAG: T9SS type A sorting domain-containing protein [Candidatus Kapabacteria bacterium]|jgi:hypothetical protein|nr:T9SS type A sorting domain-containing protein [Candidatus Kapabacteria bacterium]